MKIILVMGLPGAGKTTLANEMAPLLNAKRLNADEVRKAFLTSSAFNLFAFNSGAISFARVVLPAPGKPITKIIFIKYLLTDDGTLIQVHFHLQDTVVQVLHLLYHQLYQYNSQV